MKRGENPLTREQAIEFCREREQMHLIGAENQGKATDELSQIKSKNLADLAKIYGDIADLLGQ